MTKRKAINSTQSYGTGEATKSIIKCLEKASSASRQRPAVIFADWMEVVETTLRALPEQLKAIGTGGVLAVDLPKIQTVFQRIRSRYEDSGYPSTHPVVWQNFSQASSLLLKHSGEHGLWSFDFECRVPKIVRRRRSKMAVLDKVTETEAENGTKIVRPAHFSARDNETGRSGHQWIGPEIVRLAPKNTLDKDSEISFVTWYSQVGGLARP